MSTHELPDLSVLAHAVADRGIDAHQHAVRVVVHSALQIGLDSVALGILADETAPAVARERALGMVADQLVSSPRGVRDDQLRFRTFAA